MQWGWTPFLMNLKINIRSCNTQRPSVHWFIHPQNNLRNKDLEEGEGGLTGGQRLVPAVEFRSEGGEDGMVSSAPLLSSQSEKSHMQTVQATSGALVYLSALLSRAPSSYKSACLGERCSNLHPRSSSLHNFIHIHLRPIPRSAYHTFKSAPEPCSL